MKDLKFKKSRLIPNLSDNENRKLFRAMNFALIIGGICLISTFYFLIANLDKADMIIFYCMPGFVFGLILMILYAIGNQKLAKMKRQPRLEKTLSFSR